MTNEQFWSKVDKTETCWNWTGVLDKDGYATVSIKGRRPFEIVRAHRYAWETAHGPLAAGVHVLHDCDNASCVRPDHLHLGTQLQNLCERDARGRTAKGIRSAFSKLTEDNVYTIRRLRDAGMFTTTLGRMFSINHKTVERICKRFTWKHLPEARA